MDGFFFSPLFHFLSLLWKTELTVFLTFGRLSNLFLLKLVLHFLFSLYEFTQGDLHISHLLFLTVCACHHNSFWGLSFSFRQEGPFWWGRRRISTIAAFYFTDWRLKLDEVLNFIHPTRHFLLDLPVLDFGTGITIYLATTATTTLVISCLHSMTSLPEVVSVS